MGQVAIGSLMRDKLSGFMGEMSSQDREEVQQLLDRLNEITHKYMNPQPPETHSGSDKKVHGIYLNDIPFHASVEDLADSTTFRAKHRPELVPANGQVPSTSERTIYKRKYVAQYQDYESSESNSKDTIEYCQRSGSSDFEDLVEDARRDRYDLDFEDLVEDARREVSCE